MFVQSIERTASSEAVANPSGELIKIGLSEGSFFYSRILYLPENLLSYDIWQQPVTGELSEDDLAGIISAGQTYLAERYALECLGRLEYSRFQLTQKLNKKDFSQREIQKALDFLEKMTYLDDNRFADAWLISRVQKHPEGKSKLRAGLLQRGIDKNLADSALNTFFSETLESELLARAYEKAVRTRKSSKAVFQSLVRKGFSISDISRYVEIPFFQKNWISEYH